MLYLKWSDLSRNTKNILRKYVVNYDPKVLIEKDFYNIPRLRSPTGACRSTTTLPGVRGRTLLRSELEPATVNAT